MKTSKKLLSFFLAVVMVVTSCSVGMTAFASEQNKSIWTTDADAVASYDALDQLVGEGLKLLLQNDSIKSLLEDNLGLTITADTTINDVLGAVQPLLTGLLAKTSQEDYEEENGVAAGTYDYLNVGNYCSECGSYWSDSELIVDDKGNTWCPNGCKHVEEVTDEETGEKSEVESSTIESTQLSFFTLASLCKEYMNGSILHPVLDKEEREQVETWYQTFSALANLVNADSEVLNSFIDKFNDAAAKSDDPTEVGKVPADQTTLEELEAFDFQATDEENAELEAVYADYNAQLAAYGIPEDYLKIDSIGKAIYYFHNDYGKQFLDVYAYYKAIKTAGSDVKISYTGPDVVMGIASDDIVINVDEELTPENCCDYLFKEYIKNFPVLDMDTGSPVTGEGGEVIYNDSIETFVAQYLLSSSVEDVPAKDIERVYEYYATTMVQPFYLNYVLPNYYREAVVGLTIQHSDKVNSVDDFKKLVEDGMPEGWGTKDCVLSNEEIESMAFVLKYLYASDTKDRTSEYFSGNSFTLNTVAKSYTTKLPSVLKDTYAAEYLDMRISTYKELDDIHNVFFPNFEASTHTNDALYVSQKYVDTNGAEDESIKSNLSNIAHHGEENDGLPLLKYSFHHKDGVDPIIGSVNGLDENGNYEVSINGYLARAEEYAYGKVASELLGADLETPREIDSNVSNTAENNIPVMFDVVSYIEKVVADSKSVVLTQEQRASIFSTCDLTGEIGAKILNDVLNETIIGVVNNTTVKNLLAGLLVTKVDLTTALSDLWLRLTTSVTGTLVEVLPVLTVVFDELLVPVILNGTGDKYETLLQGIIGNNLIELGSLKIDTRQYSIQNGSYIGLTRTGWDLNELLPDLIHLLLGDTDYEYSYYSGDTVKLVDVNKLDSNGGILSDYKNSDITKYIKAADLNTTDPKYYVVKDKEGNQLTRTEGETEATFTYMGQSSTDLAALMSNYPDKEFYCTMTYESDVPFITGIYYVDNILKDIRIDNLGSTVENALNKDIDVDNMTQEEIEDAKASNATTGLVVQEAVKNIATTFCEALDIYMATPELSNDVKKGVDGSVANKGLNNIFVALPRLFDLMENVAADKYGISEDAWTYCYEGKITTKDGNSSFNNSLETFKGFASSNDSNRKYEIFDYFNEILIENWLNAIISLFNNLISTDNAISNQLPVISGLLNALGGFGEKSIITDILNSVFQITRENEFSFTFDDENTDKNNGFTGLSKDNAYFIITNLPRLIEVITNIVNSSKDSNTDDDKTDNTPYSKPKVYAPKATTAATAGSSNYSSSDLSNATDLINNLDKMLSSLLKDTTLNDFSLSKTDNILASLVTFLSNYLGRDFADSSDEIVSLLNNYLYFITGEDSHTADKNHNVDYKKVYTNDSLTGLVVETYSLVEKIAAKLLEKYNGTYTLSDNTTTSYNLLVEAIDGVISPDAVSIRLEGDYDDAAKTIAKYNSWSNMAATTSRGDYKVSIDWNIKNGDKEAFYDGLAASLRVLTSVIGVLFIDSGLYDSLVAPVFGAICTPNGITVEKYETLLNASKESGNYDDTFLAIITPVSELINLLLSKPATTLINTVQGLAGILDDKHGITIASVVNGALKPVIAELNGLANVLDKDISNLSPTAANLMREIATDTIGKYGETDKNNALVNIKVGKVYKDSNGKVIADYSLPLSGANIIPIINTYLAEKEIALKNIDWYKLSSAKTPAAALVYFLEYVFENVLVILPNFVDIGDLLDGLTAKDLLAILNQILEATDSPTMAYWTFSQYLQERSTGFKYPAGITADMANSGVTALDDLVSGIFPLLSSFGVDLGDNLQDVLNGKLFTNSLLTTIATALYGALDSLDPTVKSVINGLGIATSTKDVAKLLTDKSYGATYTSAANTIKSQSSWSKVKNVNWGFKDGSSNAQQGFVNALAAILRPVNDILAVFLNEGTLHIDDAAYEIICGLSIPKTTSTFTFELGGRKYMPRLIYSMSNGVLTLQVREDPSQVDYSRTSTLKLDFKSLKNLNDLKLEGTNGYNSAIIPLLEALQCSNVKTYAQYQKDVAKAKDNLLLDVLNPIVGASSTSLLSKLAKAPATTLTDLLPNIAMYLDADGLVQLVTNLLAPVTYALNDGKNSSVVIGDIVEQLLGAPIEDMVIPLVNGLLEDMGIKLPDIDWAFLASLGTASTYTSKSVDTNGKYLTGKTVNADNGKVLVTVLRYVAEILINNASTLKNLICSIDAVAKNDMIASIVKTVFNTISAAGKDQLVSAVFYLLAGNPSNAFWDYTSYKTGSYSFSYPEGIDVDFLKNLPPMLDGLVGSLADLNGLIAENLFTDSIITKLVKGLYGAIEGVKINDGLNLTQLLAQTGIDFSTSNVAKLLVDEDYGKTYESQAATIKAAGSWKNVSDNLKWGVTDRDSFFHALVAVLRPIYGVLDVLLNDAYLGLFDIVRIPGSNGYSSSIVPLMEAFSMYNIKTQYQYRQDMTKEYDAILLDIINPLWDKIEDILSAPLQTVAAMLPNLALFIGNNGLCQIIDNLFAPISALADAIRPIVDLNKLLPTVLDALDVDLNSLLGKIGVTNFSLDLYDLKETLKPLLGADAIIPLVNNILGMIKINGTPLGIKLNPVDWLQLASHGTTIVSASQAATFGPRIFVEGDSSETLIAVLRYLIITINTGDNYAAISSLIGGLIGGSGSDLSGTINEVLSMLEGDTDQVISDLVGLLQTIA